MPKDNEDKPVRKHTTFTTVAASVTSTTLEHIPMHSVDTYVKNSQAQDNNKVKAFKEFVWSNVFKHPVTVAKRLNQGWTPTWIQRLPARFYKYVSEREINEHIQDAYGADLKREYGSNATYIKKFISGGLTGLFEPVFFHPIDTIRVREQLRAKEGQQLPKALPDTIVGRVFNNKVFDNARRYVHDAKELGVRGVYKGAAFTGVFRNVPGCWGLFVGSEVANSALGNKDHKSKPLNLASKVAGGVASMVLSQPAEVVKIGVQETQQSALQVFRETPYKDLFFKGLGPRAVLNAGKIGFSFYIAEEVSNFFRDNFGEVVPKKTNKPA
jgi:hypothetical protein